MSWFATQRQIQNFHLQQARQQNFSDPYQVRGRQVVDEVEYVAARALVPRDDSRVVARPRGRGVVEQQRRLRVRLQERRRDSGFDDGRGPGLDGRGLIGGADQRLERTEIR